MDTSRPSSANEQETRKTSSTSNANILYQHQSNFNDAYHQKPPSLNHIKTKQINISLVDEKKDVKKNDKKKEKQLSGEWRESIPIRLEHFLFNFKENGLKVYKSSPPRFMQIIALLLALLLFCGVLALVLSQRDDNLKKEPNLPVDQSAVAERIIGSSITDGNQLLEFSQKLKNSILSLDNLKNQNNSVTENSESSETKNDGLIKDPMNESRKKFSSILFSNNDNDEIEPDLEENSSDDIERSRLKNFNLFLADNEKTNDEIFSLKEKTLENNYDPKLMFIERLMGLHLNSAQPKFGVSESLVIRKTFDELPNNAQLDEKAKTDLDFGFPLFSNRQTTNKGFFNHPNNKMKESKNADIAPFLLKYAAVAMLSKVLAAAASVQQQKLKENNEKLVFPAQNNFRTIYPRMRSESENEEQMYGRPIIPSKLKIKNQAPQFYFGDRGFSRGPLLSNEEAESQQVHPIILLFNVPLKEQQTSPIRPNLNPQPNNLMVMAKNHPYTHYQPNPAVESSVQPIFMPFGHNPAVSYSRSHMPRQNLYNYKPKEQIYSPFSFNPMMTNYRPYHSQQINNLTPHETLYPSYSHVNHNQFKMPHPKVLPVSTTYRPMKNNINQKLTNTIELPIEIHHQTFGPIISNNNLPPQNFQSNLQQVQPQISVSHSENNEPDQMTENEHHMVVFYDTDNANHVEENPYNSVINNNQAKENRQVNSEVEKSNQVSKMLLLHFVDSTGQQQNSEPNLAPVEEIQPNFSNLKIIPNQEQPEKNPLKIDETINNIKSENVFFKNEEPPTTERQIVLNETIKDENIEKIDSNKKTNENDSEPNLLINFAQMIKNAVEQQQQNQENQKSDLNENHPVPPINDHLIAPLNDQQTTQTNDHQLPPINDQQVQPINEQLSSTSEQLITKDLKENSNKEVEKTQKSVQSPAFIVVAENEEN